MQLKYQHTLAPQPERPINLICVFRDEAILLPHFIDYYKTLGVTQFFFIDNKSIDGGVDYLVSRKDINLKIFYTEGSYRDTYFGSAWQNSVLESYCKNQFCIRVDTDELLLLNSEYYPDLNSLLQEMETQDKTAVPAVLLDIYPKILNNDYQAGQAFAEHSQYFDKLNQQYYRRKQIIYQSFYWLEGGLRARTMNTFNIIHKFPIVKYIFNDNTVKPNCHFFSFQRKEIFDAPKVKLIDKPLILLHYKFLKPNFLTYLKQQIANDEHWNGSLEYKNYYSALKDKNEVTFYDENFSCQFKDSKDLDAFWNINKALLTP